MLPSRLAPAGSGVPRLPLPASLAPAQPLSVSWWLGKTSGLLESAPHVHSSQGAGRLDTSRSHWWPSHYVSLYWLYSLPPCFILLDPPLESRNRVQKRKLCTHPTAPTLPGWASASGTACQPAGPRLGRREQRRCVRDRGQQGRRPTPRREARRGLPPGQDKARPLTPRG